jgi:hypothetical protein
MLQLMVRRAEMREVVDRSHAAELPIDGVVDVAAGG